MIQSIVAGNVMEVGGFESITIGSMYQLSHRNCEALPAAFEGNIIISMSELSAHDKVWKGVSR